MQEFVRRQQLLAYGVQWLKKAYAILGLCSKRILSSEDVFFSSQCSVQSHNHIPMPIKIEKWMQNHHRK
jgi:hypothetical protein